jgi:hypothetical protein
MDSRSLITLVVALLLAAVACAALAQTASPPLILRFDREANAVPPTGDSLALPLGTEVSACVSPDGIVAAFTPGAMTIRVLTPCTSLFADGFQ